MERLAATAPKGATCCWDCTPEFQAKMIEENQCRYPEVKFVVVKTQDDECLQGVR
jgi:hypothetical protein